MENYERQYKEALERGRIFRDHLLETGDKGIAWEIEYIFPELKETEDERIRKGLIKAVFGILKGNTLYGTDVTREEALSWLEKQGEKSTNIDIDKMVMEYSQTKDGDFGLPVNCMIRAYRKGINDTLCMALKLEKQGEQKHFSDFNTNDWYVSKVDGKIHNMTYNPADKVKPKFKVGDWISGYYTNYKVMAINSKGYMVEDTDGNKINILFENEKFHHLFTIADAKDGDVLVTPSEISSESNEQIFLFKAINNRDYVDNCIEYYGCVYDGVFHKNKTGYMGTILDTFYPATKEQRDQLFQKMKEAGYEWDSEKKELKKIEVKTLDPDKVIAWLVANICDFEYYVKLFKKDFGL